MTDIALPLVGLGMLSWKSHKTLSATLESFSRADIFSLFSEKFIFFQEISTEDKAIAKHYQLSAIGSTKNLGIMGGMEAIAQNSNSRYILHLENDLQFIGSHHSALEQINQTVHNMESGLASCYRMISRKTPGTCISLKKYLRYHCAPELQEHDNAVRKMRRFLRPDKAKKLLGTSVYISEQPELKAPKWIRPLGNRHWIVDSSVLNWSNLAPFYPRSWFLEKLLPYAKQNPSSRRVNRHLDLEKELNSVWWRESHFQIGICDGLFTHARFDRPLNDEKNK